jgi:hypothetical protein
MKTIVKTGIAAAFSLVIASGTAQFAFAQQQTPAQQQPSTEQQPSTTTQTPQAAPMQPGPGMGKKMMEQGMDHDRMGQGMGRQMEGKEHGRMGQGTSQGADQTTGTSAPTNPPAPPK